MQLSELPYSVKKKKKATKKKKKPPLSWLHGADLINFTHPQDEMRSN